MESFKIGINLGWHKEGTDKQTIFDQYKQWLNICQQNNISLVRIFLTRWSINALFDDQKMDLLLSIICEAEKSNIEIILVTNHFTDFINQHYRELSDKKYIWHSYPLKKDNVKKFFKDLDTNLLLRIEKLLKKVEHFKNIKKIELFNEIDLVNISNKILIEWVNKLVKSLVQYHKRFSFFISIANHNNLNLFKNELSVPIDIHLYNFPTEYAFKNIEYFREKFDKNCYIGEYAKFSDSSHLGICESKAYFCSGLWGSCLQGLNNSPLHWWWEELLSDNTYLQIIKIFNQNIPNKFSLLDNNKYEILDIKIVGAREKNTIIKNKIIFRIKNLILHPTYLKTEWGAIKKFIRKIVSSKIDKQNILIQGFQDQNNIYFYCETKNCQQLEFNLKVNSVENKIDRIDIINLLTGKVGEVTKYQQTGKQINLSCKLSSNHLIKISI